MTAAPYQKLARVLDRMGGLFTVQDILTRIADGKMQGFVEGDSWAITQIARYPRARVIEILVAVGDLDACRKLHDRILAYAEEIGVGLVVAYGRRGWLPDARKNGWRVKTTSYLYHKEL